MNTNPSGITFVTEREAELTAQLAAVTAERDAALAALRDAKGSK
jgi:hypothetical protein